MGKIEYLNLYPVYEGLKKCQFCEFVKGEPSFLNSLLFSGEIDVAPSSSFEFIKNRDRYNLVGSFSVSSKDRVMSVLWVSEKRIEDIENGERVFLSPSSASSNSLLKILFFEFYGKTPKFEMSKKNGSLLYPNQLMIGDVALRFFFKEHKFSDLFVYDLASLWHKFTGFPFVFAVWIGNRKSFEEKMDLFGVFEKILKKAVRSYVIPEKYSDFTKDEIAKYFENIDYEFSSIHRESLKLFEELLVKWNLI